LTTGFSPREERKGLLDPCGTLRTQGRTCSPVPAPHVPAIPQNPDRNGGRVGCGPKQGPAEPKWAPCPAPGWPAASPTGHGPLKCPPPQRRSKLYPGPLGGCFPPPTPKNRPCSIGKSRPAFWATNERGQIQPVRESPAGPRLRAGTDYPPPLTPGPTKLLSRLPPPAAPCFAPRPGPKGPKIAVPVKFC